MPLQYQIVPNALTSEPSYRALVNQDVIDAEQVISDLELRIPHVGNSTIRTVIDELAKYTEEMLIQGHSVSIAGYVRFFHSIPGRLESADSTVSSDSVQVQSAISTPMEQRVRTSVSLQRLPFVEKVPSLSSIVDASGKQNYLGSLLTIKGDGLDFDQQASSQGVFVTNTHSNAVNRMSTYASVTNTQVIGLNDFITTPVTTQYNEFMIEARVRYTPNGSLRFGNYRYPSRYIRHVTDDEDVFDNADIFYTHFEGSDFNPVAIDSVTYDNQNAGVYDFTLSIKTDLAGIIRPESRLSITAISSDGGETDFSFACYEGETPVTTFVLDPLSLGNRNADDEITNIVLTIANIAEFWRAINFAYGGKIDEVIQWTMIPTPIP